MARSPEGASPKAPASLADELEDLARRSNLTPERIREDVARVQRQTSEGREQYRQLTNKMYDDMIGLLKQGANIDLEPLIAGLIESEHQSALEHQRAQKKTETVLRIASEKNRPDLFKVFNEALSAELDDIAQMAALHRDARWRLMEARAFYQPSEGVGPIRGQNTDLKDLLKN